MRSMRLLSVRILAPLFFMTLANVALSTQSSWPFDQRMILLTKIEGEDFPEDIISAQIMDVYAKKGRVRWVMKKGGVGQILPVEVPKDFPWTASAVRALGLKHKTDGVLTLVKRGVTLQLRWYAVTDGQPLFYESVSIPAVSNPEQEQERKTRLIGWAQEIWDRIPGQGYVVSRDLKNLSLEGAEQVGVKVGDKIELKRLQALSRHPLLKTLTSIDASLSGLAEVKSLENGVATAEIVYESKVDPIQEGDRYQLKIEKVEVFAKQEKTDPKASAQPQSQELAQSNEIIEEPENSRGFVPLLGLEDLGGVKMESNVSSGQPLKEPLYKVLDVDAHLFYGKVKYQESVSTTFDIADWSPGFEARVRAYMNARWLLLAEIGMGLVGFGTLPTEYGAEKMASGLLYYKAQAAWRQMLKQNEKMLGEFLIRAGWGSISLNNTQLAADVAPSGKNYSGLMVGAGLRLPVYGPWGLQVGVDRMLMATLVETGQTSGDTAVNVAMSFEGMLRYEINGLSSFYGGLKSLSASSTFSGAGTRTTPASSATASATLYNVGYEYKF